MAGLPTEVIEGHLLRLPACTQTLHSILAEACGLQKNGNGEAESLAEAAALAS